MTSHVDTFLKEATSSDPGSDEGLSGEVLYGLYLSWCALQNRPPKPAPALLTALIARGVIPGKNTLAMTGPAAADYIISSPPMEASNQGRDTPPLAWDDQLRDYVRFFELHERAPSQHAEQPAERRLFYWLRYQKTNLRSGLLLATRRAKLDQSIPNWDATTRAGRLTIRNQTAWNNRLQQLAQHVNKYARNPLVSPATRPEELSLGKWLAIQRHLFKKGSLHPDREAQLDEVSPNWRQAGLARTGPTATVTPRAQQKPKT